MTRKLIEYRNGSVETLKNELQQADNMTWRSSHAVLWQPHSINAEGVVPDMDKQIATIDYLVVLAYLVVCAVAGVISAKRSKGIDGYFRASGALKWWSAGVSAFVGTFSAWSFTSGCAKYYETGFLLLALSLVGMLPYPLLYFFAPRFRRLGVITGLDIVRLRFGSTTEAFFAFYKIPMGVLQSGLGLAIVGTFASAVTGASVESSIVVCGIFAIAISAAGGAWAVAASDFFQGLIILVIGVLVFTQLFFSGVLGSYSEVSLSIAPALSKLPEETSRLTVQAWMASAVLLQALMAFNLVDQGPNFLAARDERQIRRMVILLALIPIIVLPLIAIPAVACSTLNPDLAASFPHLARPHEAAYVWIAQKCLPSGTYGLFLAAVFAAALTSMDQGLNRNVGFFVLNVFRDRFQPQASGRLLRLMSRTTTLVFGALIVLIALEIGKLTGISLFDTVMRVNGLIVVPAAIPLGLALFVTRTPGWSGWSTVVVAFLAGVGCEWFVDSVLIDSWVAALAGAKGDAVYLRIAFNNIVVITAGVSWFLASSFFAKEEDSLEFRRLIKTPVNWDAKESASLDAAQRIDFGSLTLIFGTMMAVLSSFPDVSRLLFVCACPFLLFGAILLWQPIWSAVRARLRS